MNEYTFGKSILNVNDLKLYWKGNVDYTYKLNELIDYTDMKKYPTDEYNKR